jgi:hypothetical protein
LAAGFFHLPRDYRPILSAFSDLRTFFLTLDWAIGR